MNKNNHDNQRRVISTKLLCLLVTDHNQALAPCTGRTPGCGPQAPVVHGVMAQAPPFRPQATSCAGIHGPDLPTRKRRFHSAFYATKAFLCDTKDCFYHFDETVQSFKFSITNYTLVIENPARKIIIVSENISSFFFNHQNNPLFI